MEAETLAIAIIFSCVIHLEVLVSISELQMANTWERLLVTVMVNFKCQLAAT